jgi:hypothetical protein
VRLTSQSYIFRRTFSGFYTAPSELQHQVVRSLTLLGKPLLNRNNRIMTIFTNPSDTPMSESSAPELVSSGRRRATIAADAELVWVCDPALGVIHAQGCAVCSNFRSHFIDASSTPHDHTFQHAILKRDAKAAQRHGGQNDQDRTRMHRYRHERDEARAKVSRQEEELERLRAQLMEIQDAVAAMQQAYEVQLSGLMDAGVKSGESDVDMDVSPAVDLEPVLVADKEQVDASGLPLSSIAPHEVPPPRIVIDLTQTSSEEDIAGSWSDEQSDRDSGCPASDSSDSVVILDGPPPPPSPYSLQEIQEFVTIARDSKRSGHKEALATVESFYAKAKATPRRLRNSTQIYILLKWQTLAKPAIQVDVTALPCPTLLAPSVSLRRPDLLAQLPPSPSLANVPEIIVDASFTGIGFMSKSQWCSWKLKEGWSSSGRHINWAELVAIELGLRTAITMGVQSSPLRVRSDSTHAINVLKTHKTRNRHEKVILDQILGLARAYAIQLMPVWIWTKVNPADAISRQKYPPAPLRLGDEPLLPPHLMEFVEASYTPPASWPQVSA